MSDLMTRRYGTHRPVRRVATVVGAAVLAIAALVWLAWAAWFQGTPEVESSLVTYDVTGVHDATARVEVRVASDTVAGSCLLRAFAEDHSVVGELNFRPPERAGTFRIDQDLRTERRATAVEMIGCTAPGQPRPR